MWSPESGELLLMTAAHESLLGQFTKQVDGPALSIYQIEPRTARGTYNNYLHYRLNLADKIAEFTGVEWYDPGQLRYNIIYSTILARLKYKRSPGKLPEHWDVLGMAEYAKEFWNTSLGKATTEDYVAAYMRYVVDG